MFCTGSAIALSLWMKRLLRRSPIKAGPANQNDCRFAASKWGLPLHRPHWPFLAKCKLSDQLLRSPRHICCADECFLAKRKPSKQLRTRSTRPMRMLVVGIVELDHETKKETGRVVLRLVRNRSSRNLVRSIVRPGTTVVTDEWRGYNGLSKAGYKHQKVNHSKNEKVNAEGLGTNPVEGLFSRVRRFLRQKLRQDAFAQKLWTAACGVLLAAQCVGGADLAPQTMAESSFLAFVGDHEGGCAARVLGEASFLQARGRMSRFVGCLLLKHSQEHESGLRDTKTDEGQAEHASC